MYVLMLDFEGNNSTCKRKYLDIFSRGNIVVQVVCGKIIMYH